MKAKDTQKGTSGVDEPTSGVDEPTKRINQVKEIQSQLNRLERKITKYGEIFVDFPDVWHSNRLFDYKVIREQDIDDMRELYKEGLQATVKESHVFGVAVRAGSSDKADASVAAPQAPAKVAENLTLSPQERFRSKSTFLSEVELQKLVEGRDDNTLLQGYCIYLLRFLVSVVPGKRYRLFPRWRKFDSRNIYAEASVRIELPEPCDLVDKGLIKGEAEEKKWKATLKDMNKARKPYIYHFVPQEYVQHIGAWSAVSRKLGLDFSFPGAGTSGTSSPQANDEKQEEKPFKARGMGGLFGGARAAAPPISASLLKAYNAESEAILSNQTLIGFMRGDEEVGWLFGPRLVGQNKKVPEKGTRQVYVLIAVPGELPMVRLTMTTNWVNVRDHSKKAFNYVGSSDLLLCYYHIREKIEEYKKEADKRKEALPEEEKDGWKARWEDTVMHGLITRMDRLKFLMPIRTGRLFLPFDSSKANRAKECEISDMVPEISSIFPDSGPCNLETQVLIEGKNFDYRARIEVDGRDVQPMKLINRQILLAAIPPSKKAAAKKARVRVVTPMGISKPHDFNYTNAVAGPQITGLKPAGHPAPGEGVPVTISGNHFDCNTKALVDDREVDADFINERELLARIHEDLRGSRVSVKVYNSYGSSSKMFKCP